MPIDPRAQRVLMAAARKVAEVGARAMYAAIDEALGEAQTVVDEAGNRIRKARRRAKEKVSPKTTTRRRQIPNVEIVDEEE